MSRQKLIFSSVSFAILGIIVAIGIGVFDSAAPGSLLRSRLVYLLLPGSIAGSVLGGDDEHWVLGYFSVWFVNTALYWLLWELLFNLVRKAMARRAT